MSTVHEPGLLRELLALLDEKVQREEITVAEAREHVDLLEEGARRIKAGDLALLEAVQAGVDDEAVVDILRRELGKKAAGGDGGKSGGEIISTDDDRLLNPILPAMLPELRAHLHRMWAPGSAFHMAAPSMGHGPTRDWAAMVRWEVTALERCSLWWVAADMVDVLLAAAASVPDDVRGADLQPLDTCGMVVLEKPWLGVSSTPGQGPVKVDSFLWGPVRLPPLAERPDWPSGEAQGAVGLSAYTRFPPVDGISVDVLQASGLHGDLWAPLGRSDWPLRDALGREPWPMPEQALASFVEDRKILCALMTLLAHEGIATTKTSYPARGVRRRLERAGQRDDHSFRIVTLRTLREPGEETGKEPGEKIARDHRWIVNGHWRRQPYGRRDLNLRRLQWINPFVKGPEDAPIKMKETIHAWRR